MNKELNNNRKKEREGALKEDRKSREAGREGERKVSEGETLKC